MSLLRVPAYRRLEEEAVMFDKERDALPSGADCESDLRLILRDDPGRSISPRFFMNEMALPVLNRVLEALGLEHDPVARFVSPDGCGFDRKERAAHGVLTETLGDFGMTAAAGGIPYILDSPASVQIRGVSVDPAEGRLRSTPTGYQNGR